MTSAQIGKTEIINNIVAYHVAQDPCPMLLLMPTLDMAEAWSKDRLAPMLRDTPALRGKIKDARARDSGNTLLHKTFPGGHITMAGSNSPASLASRPVRLVLCDEVDRYPVSAGSEGDPVNLAKKRSTTFWNKKLILTSTPTVKGLSRIESAYIQSDQRKYWVPCPHCDEYQILHWANVSWPADNPAAAQYACDACGAEIGDGDKLAMLRRGEWRADANAAGAAGVAGFHISEIYSPWVKFGEMAAAFLEAKKSAETLKTFINTSLGETWEEEAEKISDLPLLDRRETYIHEVPSGVLLITAGVDVQENRLEVDIVGWDDTEQSWGIDYKILDGDTSQREVWNMLGTLLNSTLEHASGAQLPIAGMCIDSGFRSQSVYEFTRKHSHRNVWATKGRSGPGHPVVEPRQKRLARKTKSIAELIGADEAKGVLYSRLKNTTPGHGYCHFPVADWCNQEYFDQLTAEKIVKKYRRGFGYNEWIKTRTRNEALDCRVLAMAALRLLAPNWHQIKKRLVYTADARAEAESEKPQPQKATKAEQPIQAIPTQKKVAPRQPARRPGGFVNGWRR